MNSKLVPRVRRLETSDPGISRFESLEALLFVERVVEVAEGMIIPQFH